MKLSIPHVFSCHEGFKNMYSVGVRKVEGENYPEHTVSIEVQFMNKLKTFISKLCLKYSCN